MLRHAAVESIYTKAVREKKPRAYRIPDTVVPELRRLYIDEGFGYEKVGRALGYHPSTVKTTLVRLGIALHPSPSQNGRARAIPREDLQRLFLGEGKTLAEIGVIYGFSARTIATRLKQCGIRKRMKSGGREK